MWISKAHNAGFEGRVGGSWPAESWEHVWLSDEPEQTHGGSKVQAMLTGKWAAQRGVMLAFYRGRWKGSLSLDIPGEASGGFGKARSSLLPRWRDWARQECRRSRKGEAAQLVDTCIGISTCLHLIFYIIPVQGTECLYPSKIHMLES